MDNDAALDDMIRRLVAARKESKPGEGPPALSREQMTQLCAAASDVLLAEPSLLELEAPIKVCGDVHGQYTDLLRLFDAGGFPPASRYLFLGDYVDRGKRSVDTICLLLAYKVRYPDRFFLIRGNHECPMINELYGFLDECRRRKLPASLWQAFNSCFNCLPVAALVGGKILCVHGGLSPALDSLDQICDVARPASVPDQGLLSDLLWSDPAEEKGAKGWCESQRGRSYAFGADVVAGFVEKHGLDLVCRAHQMVRGGYEFFAGGKLVTVFSAPNYCGQCGNDGAIMSVDGSLRCSFEILKPLIPSAWDSDDDELTMTSSVLMLVQYIQAIFSFLRCRRRNTQNLNL